jgi:hypothetical protein
MEATIDTTPLDRCYLLVDSTLDNLKGVNMAEAAEMINVMLDLRSILDEVRYLLEN